MADQKLISLPAVSSFNDDDLLYIVTDPGGTPISHRIRIEDFFNGAPPAGGAALDDLTDVTTPSPSAGDVLTWNSGLAAWVAAAPAASGGSFGGELDDLSDVTAPSPSGGDVLTWNAGLAAWVNAAPPSGSGFGGALDDLSDVTVPSPDDGDVLTWDAGLSAWIAQAPSGMVSSASGGGGALVFLEEHIASSSAQLDFTNWYSTDYEEYWISVIGVLPATDGGKLYMRFSSDGGSTYDSATNYRWYDHVKGSGGFSAVYGSNSASQIDVSSAGTENTTSTTVFNAQIKLYNPGNTTRRKGVTFTAITLSADGNYYGEEGGGVWTSTNNINAIRFLESSSVIAEGTIRIYGVAKTATVGGGGGATELDDLTDVDVPSPADGEVLTWDAGSSEWVAAPPPSGSGFGGALDDLSDVDAPSPDDGDVLTWDDDNSEWIAAAPTGGGGPSGSVALDDLTDVDVPSPNDGDVLTWYEPTSEWRAVPPPSGAGFGPLVFLEEVVLSSPAASIHAENWYSDDYDVYVFELLHVKNTTNTQNFCMRLSTDNGATWISTASYYWAWDFAANGGGSGSVGSGPADAEVTLFTQINNTGNNEGVSGPLRLFSPGSSDRKTGIWQFYTAQSADLFATNGSFLSTGTAAVNGVQFFFASGNVASGILRVYALTTTNGSSGGGASLLNQLLDVNTPTPSAGDVLTWDADAGEWVAAPPTGGGSTFGGLVQFVSQRETAMAVGSSVIPLDNTIPQITEGTQFSACTITPTSATNKLRIRFTSYATVAGAAWVLTALFKDSGADAIQATTTYIGESTAARAIVLEHIMDAGSTSAMTFKIRMGPNSAATVTHLGINAAAYFGAADASNLTIEEIDPSPALPIVTELDDLTDVDAPSPADGDVLTWDAGTNEWIATAPPAGGPSGGVLVLDDLTDVNAPSPAHGAVLMWDEDVNEWVPAQSNAEYDAGNSGTALTLNWNNGVQQIVTLTGNVTFTFSNPVAGRGYRLILYQDATGGRVITWPASVRWEGGTAPILTTTAENVTFVSLVYTELGGNGYLGFATIAAIGLP